MGINVTAPKSSTKLKFIQRLGGKREWGDMKMNKQSAQAREDYFIPYSLQFQFKQ